jgi:hypothetical protein
VASRNVGHAGGGDSAPRAALARGRIGRGTKAKVGVAVKVAMRLIRAKAANHQFFSLWELNAAITPLAALINNCVSHHLGASPCASTVRPAIAIKAPACNRLRQ